MYAFKFGTVAIVLATALSARPTPHPRKEQLRNARPRPERHSGPPLRSGLLHNAQFLSGPPLHSGLLHSAQLRSEPSLHSAPLRNAQPRTGQLRKGRLGL